MKVTIIDNYDSFTYNLAHLVRELGAEVTVYRNDKFEMPQLMSADKIILSPGPGIPQEAGLLLDVIKQYAALKPMLGVCLGHQAIGSVFGAQLTNLSEVFHGIQSTIEICPEEPLFKGLPHEIEVGRYHSWVVDKKKTAPMPQGNSHKQRRANNGPAPHCIQPLWHTVPPRVNTHASWQDNRRQLARLKIIPNSILIIP